MMAKPRVTEVLRAHKEFANMIKNIQAKKLQQQKRFVHSSRVTLAIVNQYRKYPSLFDELEGADLL